MIKYIIILIIAFILGMLVKEIIELFEKKKKYKN